jgi:hypothetical protein
MDGRERLMPCFIEMYCFFILSIQSLLIFFCFARNYNAMKCASLGVPLVLSTRSGLGSYLQMQLSHDHKLDTASDNAIHFLRDYGIYLVDRCNADMSSSDVAQSIAEILWKHFIVYNNYHDQSHYVNSFITNYRDILKDSLIRSKMILRTRMESLCSNYLNWNRLLTKIYAKIRQLALEKAYPDEDFLSDYEELAL